MPHPLTAYFARALRERASDIHLVVGNPPALRTFGELALFEDDGVLTEKDIQSFLGAILSKDSLDRFAATHELDVALEFNGGRFRVNVHRQRGVTGIAARNIPREIPSAESIGLDERILGLTERHDGLVLVTGPSGSGKSTTLAVLVDAINRTQPAHIVTIEDPIEFLHERKRSLIEQREIGADTRDYATALKFVLRQDPNIILLGEMRDAESVEAALIAAETGHLVLSTLHTPNAAETVERIIALFPAERQRQILIQLAASLRAIVAQRLLPRTGGGLIAAREILLASTAISTLIRENKIGQIPSVLQTSRRAGMRTMAHAVEELFREGLIDAEVAKAWCG